MTRREAPETVDCGDVLVVGAGIAGVLQARELAAFGVRCTVVDALAIASQQSGHHHGYLHRGQAYLDPAPGFVAALRHAHEAWAPILRDVNVAPVTERSTIMFRNPFTRDRQLATWHAQGLAAKSVAAPWGFTTGTEGVGTEEPTFDFTPIFRGLRDALRTTTFIRAHVVRLVVRNNRCIGVDALYRGRHVRLLASHVLLAAGAGNLSLTRTATSHVGRAIVRTSYMMVLKSASLPPLSVVLPEPSANGLFVVSRPADGGNVWLASNFVSFPGSGSARIGRDWATAMFDTLRAHTEIAELADLEVGWYAARKAELRDDARDLGLYAYENHGIDRLLALSPTKITFAPLLAAEVSRLIVGRTDRTVRPGVDAAEMNETLPVQPERWRSVVLRPVRDVYPDGRSAAA